MIIKGRNNDITIEGAPFETKKATINQDEMSKLQYLLTKGLYSDPISAVIVEWTNNAVDSVVASGKDPVQNPVMVTITQNKFTVEDKGVGLTKEEFETICMNYLTSTKTESNAYIGSWGLGMKSFLSLNRSAIFTIVKNGIECKLLAYEGEEFLQYDLIHERKTEKADGVVAEVAINGWSEYNEWVRKAKKKLAYYDTVALFIEGNLIQNQIIRSTDWQYSPLAANNMMHLCLKDVYYEINWDKLQIPGGIGIGIALRFGLDDGFSPTPSREALIWNEHTIKKVKDRIASVADWFADTQVVSNQKRTHRPQIRWILATSFIFFFMSGSLKGTAASINATVWKNPYFHFHNAEFVKMIKDVEISFDDESDDDSEEE